MKILIPMAGEGKRFTESGYKINKAVLPIIYRKTGIKCPMVVCSVLDLPGIHKNGDNIAFVMRRFHFDMGIDNEIRKWYPKAVFFVAETLTEGQACTCMLAQNFIDKEDLLIAACDNGIEYDIQKFEQLKQDNDFIVFTSRHNSRAQEYPDSFGWVYVDANNKITGVSVKKHISDMPENDHAIVATFWFKTGDIFTKSVNRMIHKNDRINNEFYVDQAIKHALELGYTGSVFEVERFLNYGTPHDYECYCKTIKHFCSFVQSDIFKEMESYVI